jgi:putative ABC transport system substrate-binding protein
MSDPIGQGLITSLAYPGGNVTGLSDLSPELVPKCLALLKETVPGTSRVAALFYPDAFSERTGVELLQGAMAGARKLGVDLHVVRVKRPEDIDGAFSTIKRDRAEAVVVLPGPLTFIERRRIVDLTMEHRLPAAFWRREFVEVGGLLSYGIDYSSQFRRGAAYVEKILKGAKPSDLPVEQPSKFQLIVNLKTAKELGVTIPATLLAQADEVIE